MTYQDARVFIEETKKYGSILGLTSIRNLMQELGNVQEEIPIIHIAGTNGKGSTGAFIERILRENGYLVGRYSSPAVFSEEEIYQLNGKAIGHAEYASCMDQVAQACKRIVGNGMPHPTSFEVETAVAFLYFYQKNCDFLVLETGMGGSTDATNLISHPVCSVITTISMDHMAFLGNSLSKIAEAKAGIIKTNCPVVSAVQLQEVEMVLRKRARDVGAVLYMADETAIGEVTYDASHMSFVHCDYGTITTQLPGAYQVRNAACALKTIEVLAQSSYAVTKQAVVSGMCKAYWPGRFERLMEQPEFIIDGAHNEDAAYQLRATIENCFTNRTITYIIGVLADKEHEKMLRILLPLAQKVYTVTPDNKRALSAEKLRVEACKYHSHVEAVGDVRRAVTRAVGGAAEDEVIVAFGSLSYLAAVKESLNEIQSS